MNNEKNIEEKLSANISDSLDENISALNVIFQDVDILRLRTFENVNTDKLKYAVFYTEGLVDVNLINFHIIKPLINSEIKSVKDAISKIEKKILSVNAMIKSSSVDEITEAIAYGDTVLFVDGCAEALIIASKMFSMRSISEPEGERVLSGPRDGFTEGIMMNVSLIRRRILSGDLKFHFMKLGVRSKTSICVSYIDGIVNKKILDELYRRLEGIKLDDILDGNYLVEYIAEKSFLCLNTTGATERPDVVAGKLLEGRIAVFVDGSPVVITLPYLFIENFQSSEDYYMNPLYASFSRILRILCFIGTTTFAGLYIAIVAYHQEVLPSSLMVNFMIARSKVPLPASLECFVMLILFDILLESGVRMPSHVGQAMSIVGALVIGQAAVEANLVAAPVVIIVAFTGITILLVPRLTATSLFIRYMCLLFSSILGFVGVMVSVAIVVIHIFNMRSFGVPIILDTKQLGETEPQDVFVRKPWPKMIRRIRPIAADNVRQAKYGDGKRRNG